MSMRPDDHRRKWDKKEFERKALDRIQKINKNDEAPPEPRELLKTREYKVDLDSKLGKSMVINKTTPSNQSGGYFCNVCDCVVKDSINFLDHINGKKHQRNLGMSMKVERSSLESVKERFNKNKRKIEEKKDEYDLQVQLKNVKDSEEKRKQMKKKKRKEQLDESKDDDEMEMAKMMGFAANMGSYLDKPETSKKSENNENEILQIGSSSMQGWRVNQEDAHNSILNFDENTAFFAVYDGHGGSEVAEYCSMKLPQFLQDLQSFKKGDYEQALKDAFIGFDGTLLNEKVIEELLQLARKNPDYVDSDMEIEDETAEEIINLHEEAKMPLNEVLKKYKGKIETLAKSSNAHRAKEVSKTETSSAAGPSSSSCSPGSSGSSTVDSRQKIQQKLASDNEVSSSSSKAVSESDTDAPEPTSSSGIVPEQAPDSTHTIPKVTGASSDVTKPKQSTTDSSEVNVEPLVPANGVISCSERKISQKQSDDEAISSSSTQENGESIISCPTSSQITSGVSSASNLPGSSSSPSKTPIKDPNQISSSLLPDTDTDSSSDEEFDATYKESSGPKPLNSDDDTTDEDEPEDVDDDEEIDEEEISGDEEEDEDESFDDEFINNMATGPGKASGCTAVVALLSGRNLYVANAGDSRCVVCRSGKVVEMSFDHKPEDEIEFERIRKAGGRVTLDGRVNGGLNLSRAIGDHGYKMNFELPSEEQMISALPDIKNISLEPEDEFMVLACDGIWNYMSNEEVVGFVKLRIDAGKLTLAEICEELFQNCLAPNTMGDGTGCDNMTAIIVKFKPALFQLPTSANAEENVETEKVSRKRSLEDGEAEALPTTEKRQKIEDDLTPAAVDTSTA
ncbi:CLUMA_CG020971, isoform A [Clunio marinus]|uniref:protein-serine/threonine phosphatase n=1 Tax=Clunio marinus TaxID=568069 RepID=A0A1J1J6B0_9DIPT|nr:CLUMA_CG020971, isoform A [Clunio marinus]